jgi:hypothetical protein
MTNSFFAIYLFQQHLEKKNADDDDDDDDDVDNGKGEKWSETEFEAMFYEQLGRRQEEEDRNLEKLCGEGGE